MEIFSKNSIKYEILSAKIITSLTFLCLNEKEVGAQGNLKTSKTVKSRNGKSASVNCFRPHENSKITH